MLTHRQRQLFNFIAGELGRTGIAPSRQEMATHLGMSNRGHTDGLVNALVERGFVRRLRYRPRAIEIVKPTNVVPIDRDMRVAYLRFNATTKKLEPL